MRTERIFGVLVVVLWIGGCATAGSQVSPEVPQAPNSEPDDGDGGEVTENPPPAARPSSVTIEFGYPDDWTPEPDPEQNLMVLRHSSGSAISFTIWPLEQASPSARIIEIWTRVADATEQGAPLEAGSPISETHEGVESSYLLATLTDDSDQRFTLFWLAFSSNYPGLGVLVTGAWHESMNAEMYTAIREIAGSIRVVEQPPESSQAPTADSNISQTLLVVNDFEPYVSPHAGHAILQKFITVVRAVEQSTTQERVPCNL